MADSQFNTEEFLDSSVSGKNDTQIIPPPEGEFLAIAERIDAGQTQSDDPKPYLRVTWDLQDDRVKEETKRDKVTCSQTIFLDLDSEGRIDMGEGRNVQLGRLREALGQNDQSEWRPRDIEGQMATVRVRHKPDKENPEIVYANVVGVQPAA